MKKSRIFNNLKDTGIFENIDLYSAEFIAKRNPSYYNETFITVSLLLYMLREKGHICIPINKIQYEIDGLEQLKELVELSIINIKDMLNGELFEKEDNPLVYENESLYIKRFYLYEKNIREFLKRKSFVAITGGPGTGKTTKIARTICELIEKDKDVDIKLCAPTGKAASRISESIQNAKAFLEEKGTDKNILEKVPEEATTIHRLLGYRFGKTTFKHNKENPLLCDYVFVDEASMIDLPLMAKLIDALGDNTKLVLVGDKDQLASVEAGAVFGDICEKYEGTGIVERLSEVFRQQKGSSIPVLSEYINNMQYDNVIKLLKSSPDDIFCHERLEIKEIVKIAIERYSEYIKALKNNETDLAELYKDFNRFRVLCSMRKGLFGTENLNRMIKKEIYDHPSKEYFHGMPIMITQNDYSLGIYNGDTALVKEKDDKAYAVFFDKTGAKKEHLLTLIPKWEVAFALTIHKSQGSEFDDVMTVLTGAGGFLTKELLYTALTRAKKNFILFSQPDTLKECVSSKISRYSNL